MCAPALMGVPQRHGCGANAPDNLLLENPLIGSYGWRRLPQATPAGRELESDHSQAARSRSFRSTVRASAAPCTYQLTKCRAGRQGPRGNTQDTQDAILRPPCCALFVSQFWQQLYAEHNTPSEQSYTYINTNCLPSCPLSLFPSFPSALLPISRLVVCLEGPHTTPLTSCVKRDRAAHLQPAALAADELLQSASLQPAGACERRQLTVSN